MNGTEGISDIEGKAARVAAREQGSERVSNSCLLFAGSLGCGDDLAEALIPAQIIPARIEIEIAATEAISARLVSLLLQQAFQNADRRAGDPTAD